jgi:hypothetical protein
LERYTSGSLPINPAEPQPDCVAAIFSLSVDGGCEPET